jgi:hypothetical protein
VALSGAPRVTAAHAPEMAHRCTCRAHASAGACDCAICRKAALAARASDERLPPCHRAAAREALSRERPAEPTSPCVEGTCGGPGETARLPPSLEPFSPPSNGMTARAPRGWSLVTVAAAAPLRALEPDVPPPRPA